MPKNVKYSKEAEAKAYASEVGGHVIGHDDDKDGHPDTWTVVEIPEEGATEGPSLRDFEEGTPEYEQQEQWLKDVDAGGKPPERNMGGAFVDELGYRHGGMTNPKRDPIKYAAGGAVRGKRFVGSF
jgi:hypothetical protein